MRKARPSESRCDVVAQATMKGSQHVTVRGFPAEDGWRTPYLAVRVGSVLINIQDHDALLSLTEAVRAANLQADRVFGERRQTAYRLTT